MLGEVMSIFARSTMLPSACLPADSRSPRRGLCRGTVDSHVAVCRARSAGRAQALRDPRASSRRQHGAARENRHDLAQHQPARPAIYRIKKLRSPHRRHVVHLPDVRLRPPIEDALEQITHSSAPGIRDQRRSTTGLLERLAEGGLLARPLPQQIEFARPT